MYLLIFLFRNLSTWSRLVLNEAWYDWRYHSRYVRQYYSNKAMFYGADFYSKEQELEHVEKRTIIHSEQELAQNKRRFLSDDQINCRIKVYMASLRYWLSNACNAYKIVFKDTDLHGWPLKFEKLPVIVTGRKQIVPVTHEIVPVSDRWPAAISCAARYILFGA